MITVETLPVRLSALQWHKPGDCGEFVVPYKLGKDVRYGVHGLRGLQPVTAGDWIVIGNGSARVYSPGEFRLRFRIVEGAEA